MASVFETCTCSRCGGSGNYSYCPMYGTMCFKCVGAGRVLTKRGVVAQAYFTQLCTVLVTEIEVGDVVKVDWGNGWAKVESIGFSDSKYKDKDGEWQSYYEIKTNKGNIGTFPHSTIRKGQSVGDKAKKIQQALDYQASLTKLGKVSKNKKVGDFDSAEAAQGRQEMLEASYGPTPLG